MAKIGEPIPWDELPYNIWRGNSPNPFLNDIMAKMIATDYLHVVPIECIDGNERRHIQAGLLGRARMDRKNNIVRGWRLRTVSKGLVLYVYKQPIVVGLP